MISSVLAPLSAALVFGAVSGSVATWWAMDAAQDRAATRYLEEVIKVERQANERARAADRRHRERMDIVGRDNRRLRERIASSGLHDPGTVCTGRGGATIDPAGCAAGRRLSDEVARFLESEARRADELRAYAATCHEFVTRVQSSQ